MTRIPYPGRGLVRRLDHCLVRCLGLAAVAILVLSAAASQRAEALSLINPAVAPIAKQIADGLTTEVRGGHGGHGGFHSSGGFRGAAIHSGGFRSGPVFRSGGFRSGHVFRSSFRRGGFAFRHHHHRFHRRFYYAPSYYYYPHRYCRVIWTYYGPRKICRYRPWYRHHWRRHHRFHAYW